MTGSPVAGLLRRYKIDGPMFAFLHRAVMAAAKSHGLLEMMARLEAIVPDLTNQYSHVTLDQEHLRVLCRANHAFQMRLLLRAVDSIPNASATVVDIGDSSGTHMQYLRRLRPDREIETISVNLDPKAIAKIQAKGMRAVLSSAEDLDLGDKRIDLFVTFETAEHLLSPALFLYRLARSARADRLLVTVPYLPRSRVALYSLRGLRRSIEDNTVNLDRMPSSPVHAENEHFFELSPTDWKSLMLFCGWRPASDEVFQIAPRHGLYSLARLYWRRVSFTGFLGIYAERDLRVAERYLDWPALS